MANGTNNFNSNDTVAFLQGKERNGKMGFVAAGTIGVLVTLGRMMKISQWAKTIEGASIPMLGQSIPIGGVLRWASGKGELEQKTGWRKKTHAAGDFVDTRPKEIMATTVGEVQTNTKKRVTELVGKMVGVEATAKVPVGVGGGSDGYENLPENNPANPAVGFFKKAGQLNGHIKTGIGSSLMLAEDKLNIVEKTQARTQAAREELKALGGGAEKWQDRKIEVSENKATLLNRAKKTVKLKTPTMAEVEVVSKSLKSASKRLHAAKLREERFSKMSNDELKDLFAKKDMAVNRLHEFQTQAIEGVEGDEAKKIAFDIAMKNRTTAQKRQHMQDNLTIKRATPRGGLEETQNKILEKLEKDTGEGAVSSKVTNKVAKIAQKHREISELEAKEDFWKDPAKNMGKRFKNMTLSQGADYLLRYGSLVQQGVGTFHSLMDEKRALLVMMADEKGVSPRDISSWDFLALRVKGKINAITSLAGFELLKVNESPIVQEALKQYSRGSMIDWAGFAGVAVGQAKVSKFIDKKYGNSTFGSIAISMGIPMLLNKIREARAVANDIQPDGQQQAGLNPMDPSGGAQARRENVLQIYAGYRMQQEAQRANPEQVKGLTATDYTDLITTASSAIKKMGGSRNQGVQLMAQYYYLKQIPVEEVLKDLNKGKEHMLGISKQGAEEMTKFRDAQLAARQEAVEASKPTSLFSEMANAKSDEAVKSFAAQHQRRAPAGSHVEALNQEVATGAGKFK